MARTKPLLFKQSGCLFYSHHKQLSPLKIEIILTRLSGT